jgi:hypothetical protein
MEQKIQTFVVGRDSNYPLFPLPILNPMPAAVESTPAKPSAGKSGAIVINILYNVLPLLWLISTMSSSI